MDIQSLDLNLLNILDAMLQHRSVTKTAAALGMSQPATSGALSRLRVLFDDPLFVKTGIEMKPTARAMELAEPVRLVIETVKRQILQTSRFDPSNSNKTFTVLMPDIAEIAFLPAVLDVFSKKAPEANLRSRSVPPNVAATLLQAGEAELAIGFFPDLLRAGFYQQRLFKTSYVCIACTSNKSFESHLTLKAYLSAKHAVVRPDGREHLFESFVLQRRLKRRVAIEVSHFMSLQTLLPGTDLIATVPLEIADAIARHVDIRRSEVPLRAPSIDVHQFWHERFHKDPANMWLRETFQRLYQR